jgi:regulator of replication initiation timing
MLIHWITFRPVRIPVLLFSLLVGCCATTGLRAQDPGAQQDAEAAREKLLKASDELDNIQANSESTKAEVDGMKADVTQLQTELTQVKADNAALTQQLADMQAALNKSEEARIKERETLIDTVADMIAASKGSGDGKPAKKKKETPTPDTTESPTPTKTPAADSSTTSLTPPPDPGSAASNASGSGTGSTSADDDSAPSKPQKGYYHLVASGETLTLICDAYRDEGVKVTVAEIRKANGLTVNSVLKVGQKLFIPKPGT